MFSEAVLSLSRQSIIKFAEKALAKADEAKAEFAEKLSERYVSDLMTWKLEEVIKAEAIASFANELSRAARSENILDEEWPIVYQKELEDIVERVLRGTYSGRSTSPFSNLKEQTWGLAVDELFRALGNFWFEVRAEERLAAQVEAAGGEEAYKSAQAEKERRSTAFRPLREANGNDLWKATKSAGLKGVEAKKEPILKALWEYCQDDFDHRLGCVKQWVKAARLNRLGY